MYKASYWLSIVIAPLLVATAQAESDKQILRTDWIEQTQGYQEKSVGAEVRQIENDDADGSHKLTLAIPKTLIADPGLIEEVVVVGKKPDEAEPLLNTRLEWLDDYDNDNYGLVIHLGENSNWPLRLYMSAKHGYLHIESTRLMDSSTQPGDSAY